MLSNRFPSTYRGRNARTGRDLRARAYKPGTEAWTGDSSWAEPRTRLGTPSGRFLLLQPPCCFHPRTPVTHRSHQDPPEPTPGPGPQTWAAPIPRHVSWTHTVPRCWHQPQRVSVIHSFSSCPCSSTSASRLVTKGPRVLSQRVHGEVTRRVLSSTDPSEATAPFVVLTGLDPEDLVTSGGFKDVICLKLGLRHQDAEQVTLLALKATRKCSCRGTERSPESATERTLAGVPGPHRDPVHRSEPACCTGKRGPPSSPSLTGL